MSQKNSGGTKHANYHCDVRQTSLCLYHLVESYLQLDHEVEKIGYSNWAFGLDFHYDNQCYHEKHLVAYFTCNQYLTVVPRKTDIHDKFYIYDRLSLIMPSFALYMNAVKDSSDSLVSRKKDVKR